MLAPMAHSAQNVEGLASKPIWIFVIEVVHASDRASYTSRCGAWLDSPFAKPRNTASGGGGGHAPNEKIHEPDAPFYILSANQPFVAVRASR